MKKFEITQEQIKQLHHNSIHENNQLVSADLKSWFPEAFEKHLEVGVWYKSTKLSGCFVFLETKKKGRYGFDSEGWYRTQDSNLGVNTFLTKATPQEVEAALIAEAKKRGFVKGAIFTTPVNKIECTIKDYSFKKIDNCLYLDGMALFNDGKWATIVETITKEEAEKLLNKKIV